MGSYLSRGLSPEGRRHLFPLESSRLELPQTFGVYLLHSLGTVPNEVSVRASVHPGQTATPAKVLRATGRYSMRRGDSASTPTSRLYTQDSLKAAEPHLEGLKLNLRREGVYCGMREESLLR
jgi:hypothetical protein